MQLLPSLIVAFALALSILNTPSDSAKILAVFPFPGPSQYIVVQPYLKALAERGHEVTVISGFPQKQPIENFRDIAVTSIFEEYKYFLDGFTHSSTKWQAWNFFSEFLKKLCLRIFNNDEVQTLLHSNAHFDLVIVETLLNDALYGFAQHFKAALIGVSSYGTDPHIDELVGNTSPSSYLPLVSIGYTDNMNFWQRIVNFLAILLEQLHVSLVFKPQQMELYRQYFPNATVELMDLRRNFSLILLNNHFSLSFPRPYVPNMIQVGGFHLSHKPTALPKDMEAFINGSSNGVIYFSMGSNIKSKDFPSQTLDVIMKVFASLPQNVMWKFENSELPGKPDNVFISKWFPQPDILAHPNVKLFITHGGLLSTIEAIYHGKPVVGLPVFYDQFLNVERAEKAGYGVGLDLQKLNEVDFRASIERVLSDPSYAETAAKMSRRYRDQPMTPLDTAIYWTEYVLRHEGAPFMRVSAQNLHPLQYHNVDVMAVLIGVFLLALFLILSLTCKLCAFLFGRKKKRKVQ